MREFKGYPCAWNDEEWDNFHDPYRIGKQVCVDSDDNPVYHGDLFLIRAEVRLVFHNKIVAAFCSRLYTRPSSNALTFRMLKEPILRGKENDYSVLFNNPDYNITKVKPKTTLVDPKYESLYS